MNALKLLVAVIAIGLIYPASHFRTRNPGTPVSKPFAITLSLRNSILPGNECLVISEARLDSEHVLVIKMRGSTNEIPVSNIIWPNGKTCKPTEVEFVLDGTVPRTLILSHRQDSGKYVVHVYAPQTEPSNSDLVKHFGAK